MSDRIFLDTNLLVYAVTSDPRKKIVENLEIGTFSAIQLFI